MVIERFRAKWESVYKERADKVIQQILLSLLEWKFISWRILEANERSVVLHLQLTTISNAPTRSLVDISLDSQNRFHWNFRLFENIGSHRESHFPPGLVVT